MKKPTIKELELQLAIQKAENGRLRAEDERLRRVLCDMLDHVEYTKEGYAYSNLGSKRTVVIESWEGIAFLIGELRADADYSINISRREELTRENEELKNKLNDLLSPKKDS